jgi:hypothetical protein
MATSTGAYFAGVGTTFVFIALGFGGGLMVAKSVFNEPSGYQARGASEAPAPVRVILPHSAEPAQPPQQQAASPPEPTTPPAVQPTKEALAPVEKQIDKADTRKAEAEERKRRYAERKARRQAEARARQQREQQARAREDDTPIVAIGDDERPRFGGGLFGN